MGITPCSQRGPNESEKASIIESITGFPDLDSSLYNALSSDVDGVAFELGPMLD